MTVQLNNHINISASILAANFAKLGEEINAALTAGVDWIHFDVMDHHFVPNLSFGAVVCQSLRQAGITAPIDVHLMVSNPEDYIEPFAKAGANLITFHPETSQNVQKCLQHIHSHGMKAGLAINPDKSLCVVEDYINDIELLLLMSVYPGFGGQSFIEATLEKVSEARDLMIKENSKAKLGIDGGVKLENIDQVVSAGADFCIIGSGLFHAKNYQTYMKELREKIS